MAARRRAIMRRALGRLHNQCASRPASLANQQPSCIDELRATMGATLARRRPINARAIAHGRGDHRAPSALGGAATPGRSTCNYLRSRPCDTAPSFLLPCAASAHGCRARMRALREGRISPIRSTTRTETPSSACTRSTDEFCTNGFSSSSWPERIPATRGGGAAAAAAWIQLAVGPQPLWLRNHNSGLAQWIMVKRLATSPHDPLGITDSAYKNQLVVVSVQYGPFYPYIPIRSTTIGKLRVAIDPITMRTSWRSNSDIASVTSIGYQRMSARGESSTTMHRLLHASGSHPIPMPYDPKRVGKWVKVRRLSCRVSMTFRVVRTNQYNQDLGLIHSTNGNHLESPKEGSSIDHQVTIYLHAQNITMFPTNETWYFASQILVSNSGGLILILTAQSTRNMFRIHSDY
ncbi:hypothetical protein F511_23685 [Dorcoceras hygrometricum]|uniref:Triacylglycerol lipase n=2 Tax=Dorcoceras hygrometricum TaxID=472368 RepID=A0A2Z7DF17_9LAMI|nr:hypothetical protein F511_23685 [Dorcoceras hygrometricum]